MAHFAKLGINGKVLSVEVVADADCQGADGTELESIGVDFLNRTHGWPLWAKTSYNTRGGKYYDADGSEASDQSKAFRGNYAGIGYTWSEDENIFWPAQPHTSWTKNTTTASWDEMFVRLSRSCESTKFSLQRRKQRVMPQDCTSEQ